MPTATGCSGQSLTARATRTGPSWPATRAAPAVWSSLPMAVPLIEMRSISKAFPGVQALKDVSLAIHGGEIHMLVGQNGAGKSSLIKVLCGAYRPDHGEFLLGGAPVPIASTKDARRLGIAVIFQ